MSRHDLAVVPMATVRPSATALGIFFDYLMQVLIKIINPKFQTIPFRSSFPFALKAK